MKKILIFGINGFVGRYLTEELKNNNYSVYGSDISDNVDLKDITDYYKADITDNQSVYNVIEKIRPDAVINLAAISSVGQSWIIPQKTISINVIGCLNILEAIRVINRNADILLVGSSEEYDVKADRIDEGVRLNANNPYGVSKSAQEQLAKIYSDRYGMMIHCVRAFNHTGVGQREDFVLPSFCKQVAEIEKSGKAGTIKVGNLRARRDFSHVRDVVRAYRMVLESNDCTKVYNVGAGIAYELEELLQYIISLSTQHIKVEIDSERFRPIDTPIICCDNGLIKKELGWTPKEDVYIAIKEMYEYFLKGK